MPQRLNKPAHYLFIVARLDTGTETIRPEVLLERRLKRLGWPLNRGTRHTRTMRPGDRVLFYVARGRNSYVAAQARVASDSWKPTSQELRKLQAAGDEYLAPEYYVRLDGIAFLPVPVPALQLLGSLDLFVGAGKFWGTRLQGGVKRLSARDFQRIVAVGGALGETLTPQASIH